MTLGQTLKEWAEPAAVRRGENVPSHNEIVHSSLTGGCTNGLENSLLGKEDLCLDWEAEIQPFQWGICPQTPPLVAPRTVPPSDGSSVLWFELGSCLACTMFKILKMCCQYLKSRLLIEKFELGASLEGLTALVLHSHCHLWAGSEMQC